VTSRSDDIRQCKKKKNNKQNDHKKTSAQIKKATASMAEQQKVMQLGSRIA